MSIGPVLAIEDAVGLKMRALHDRTTHRDLIDVPAAAAAGYSVEDLERFGRRHTPDFAVADLADRLGAIVDLNDRGFAAYGLDDEAISELRSWAAGWEANMRTRQDPEPRRNLRRRNRTGTPTSARADDVDWLQSSRPAPPRRGSPAAPPGPTPVTPPK
jgi:hypothetical protein